MLLQDAVTVWDGKWIQRTTRDLAEAGMLAGTMQVFDERGIWSPQGNMLYPQEFPFVPVDTPAPTLSDINPTTAAANVAQQITCTGTGFETGSVVKAGTKSLSTDYINATTLIAYLPKTTAGGKNITVVNPDGDVTDPALIYTAT